MTNIKRTLTAGLLAAALNLPTAAAADNDHGQLRVPPGHLPPPGKCRIWYPGRPPGHQPAHGDCRVLSRQLPRGAWLVSRDRIWRYEERPDYHYHRPRVYSGKHDSRDDDRYRRSSYSRPHQREVDKSVQDVRQARKELRENREQLQKDRAELKKDRAELRKDIRDGARRSEIRQDRREIREDVQKLKESKKEVRQSQDKLEAARQDLREDLRRR